MPLRVPRDRDAESHDAAVAAAHGPVGRAAPPDRILDAAHAPPRLDGAGSGARRAARARAHRRRRAALAGLAAHRAARRAPTARPGVRDRSGGRAAALVLTTENTEATEEVRPPLWPLCSLW